MRIRGAGRLSLTGIFLLTSMAAAQVSVPAAPSPDSKPQPFHDKHFGVRFEIPAGWSFAQKDRQVSTFHLDARSAAPKSEMRGVAAIGFNPFPLSTFSGALFYYSVEKHSNDHECALEAYSFGDAASASEDVGGMSFLHGHDEHGGICVESRDEVYTAYRKGSCYRFDLTVNTFCSISSGALDMSKAQVEEIDRRMEAILSSVVLDWKPPAAAPGTNPNRRVMPAPEGRATPQTISQAY